MQCRFESWEVTGPRSIRLRMPNGNCCDMRAAVRIAEIILPCVQAVHTIEGGYTSTTYWKDSHGEWFADNGSASRRLVDETPTCIVTNSSAAQEYCDALSGITGANRVCVERRPLYVAVCNANYGRLSALVTECQGSPPHLSVAMTGFGYHPDDRRVIFNGRSVRGHKVSLIAQAVDSFLSAELPDVMQ